MTRPPVFDLPVDPGRDPRRAAARVTAAGLTYPAGELSLTLLSLVLLEVALAPMVAAGVDMAVMLHGRSLSCLRTRMPRARLRVGHARAAGLLCDL